MPQMANITVKKADGTTDIVWSAMQPSSGDGVPAVWRSETVGTTAAVKPTLSTNSRWNGPRTARRVDGVVWYPQKYTDTNTGLDLVANRGMLQLSGLLPTAMPDTDIAELVAQATNLFSSALYRAVLTTGYAPS